MSLILDCWNWWISKILNKFPIFSPKIQRTIFFPVFSCILVISWRFSPKFVYFCRNFEFWEWNLGIFSNFKLSTFLTYWSTGFFRVDLIFFNLVLYKFPGKEQFRIPGLIVSLTALKNNCEIYKFFISKRIGGFLEIKILFLQILFTNFYC